MATTGSSPLRRFLAVPADAQTYRNLAYVLLAFPLGLCYWVGIWVGGAVGISTVPILIGVPILAGVVVLSVHLAVLEARLASDLLGVDVTFERSRPDEETIVQYLLRLLGDSRTYLAIAYLLTKFVLGVVAFVALTVAASLSVTLLLAPVLYSHTSIEYQFGVWTVDSFAGALGCSALGVVAALGTLHIGNVSAWLLGEHAAALLGSSGTDAAE